MKKSVLILLTMWLATTAFCQNSTRQQLDELLKSYQRLGRFNGSVLVARKDTIILQKGYGYRNASMKSLNDPNSIYQTYSITKTFTSTLIMKLAEEQKLSVSDPLSKYYPDFPKGDSILISHLLSHTSGIYDYTHGNDMKTMAEDEFLDFLKTKPLNFSPGQGWSYSNSNYWLLGFIIEKCSGLTYEAALKRYIFDPLNMTNSGLYFSRLNSINKTIGYSVLRPSVTTIAEVYQLPGPWAAGGIYSTVGDLFKYYQGLSWAKIISDSSLRLASKPVLQNYGFGWISQTHEGISFYSHSGGAAGYRSNFIRVPDGDICIVLLNNTETANLDLISNKILDILSGKPVTLLSEIQVAESQLQKYTGTYSTENPSLVFYVTVRDQRLCVQVSRQPETIVYAQKQNLFYAEEPNAFIEFIPDSTKQEYRIEIKQGDKIFGGKKIPATWGLVGDAVTRDWFGNADIPLAEDSAKKGVWYIRNLKMKTGEFKFRFNQDWTINFGDNENDFKPDRDGRNIRVQEGSYDIVLDLRDGNRPLYSLKKR